MKWHQFFLFLQLAAVACPMQSQPPEGQQTVRDKIVGTWTLVSTAEKLRDGTTRPYPDLGPNASGYLMYSKDGHMCAMLMKPSRPEWHDSIYPSDAEKLTAGSGFTAYCGTYSIDEKLHVIVHHPEVSYSPNFIGTDQPRPYRFEGNRLVFSGIEKDGEVERWTIVWEKAPFR
jgi:hypothetical protein